MTDEFDMLLAELLGDHCPPVTSKKSDIFYILCITCALIMILGTLYVFMATRKKPTEDALKTEDYLGEFLIE